jgi:tetratricopeptide (TPR) repeat protein
VMHSRSQLSQVSKRFTGLTASCRLACLFAMLLLLSASLCAQSSSSSQQPAQNPKSDSNPSKPSTARQPDLSPPRSDRINADALEDGTSSSKNTQIDLAPPADDTKTHPKSADILMDAETSPGSTATNEFHPWDPHKAAKDVEVGDFYFKRKNYRAAEDRYREALYYKDNDAVATFRLGVCLEKLAQPDEARQQYENYLKILPDGPESEEAKKSIERLKNPDAASKAAK